ncbi:hypothetical protein ACPWSR_02155 [Alloiococcus sp. CFN-8]|uniref:hypothetical protein n=1 Tax=Alloiococcus sp. CFN-8 TaxID=3416081 RepID=UPI003CF45536
MVIDISSFSKRVALGGFAWYFNKRIYKDMNNISFNSKVLIDAGRTISEESSEK